MSKITANETHRWDDIADTAADAIKFALIDKIIIQATVAQTDYNQLAKTLNLNHNKNERLRKSAFSRQ